MAKPLATLSVAFWYRMDDDNGYDKSYIVSNGCIFDANTTDFRAGGWCFVGYGKTVEADAYFDPKLGNVNAVRSDALTTKTWHHIAVTWNNTAYPATCAMYIDGKLAKSGASGAGFNPMEPIGANNNDLRIGPHWGWWMQYENTASFCDLRVYKRILNTAEITALAR
ncbi:MAG TPA: LamG-like jellyroll fold domain-containing protein [Armatimonadota bacterium]